jgi:hypothetical protein
MIIDSHYHADGSRNIEGISEKDGHSKRATQSYH